MDSQMDVDLHRASRDVPFSPAPGCVENELVGEHSANPVECTLCRTPLSPDSDELESIGGVCSDCKVLLLQDLEASSQDSHPRRHSGGRRLRNQSSDSTGNLFFQQMSHMINLVRQNQFADSALEDDDASPIFVSSTRTTSSGSRRLRWVVSDTESEEESETDSSRSGAPPAAASFVKNLPRITINSKHGDELDCSICKDVLSIGTEVNQLPCLHIYHPSCILPWLRTRNSCPLCRLELPTDDRRRRRIYRADEDASYVSEGDEPDEAREYHHGGTELRNNLEVGPGTNSSTRSRWVFIAAAPIVSLVGIVLVLWLGNPQRRRSTCHSNLAEGGLHQTRISASQPDQRDNKSRRWWSLF